MVFAVALLAAACGDDSGGPGAGFGDGGSGGGGGDLSEQLEEQLEDLGDLGDEVRDAVDQAADVLDSFGDSTGSATVEVNGVTYTATEPEFCFMQGDDVTFEGVGEGSDGSMAWVSVSRTIETEEELLEFFDQALVDSMVDENGISENVDVSVEVGRVELFSSGPDDQPNFNASVSPVFTSGELEWSIDGNTFTGSGQVMDNNNVVVQFPDTVPVSFEVSCG